MVSPPPQNPLLVRLGSLLTDLDVAQVPVSDSLSALTLGEEQPDGLDANAGGGVTAVIQIETKVRNVFSEDIVDAGRADRVFAIGSLCLRKSTPGVRGVSIGLRAVLWVIGDLGPLLVFAKGLRLYHPLRAGLQRGSRFG